MIAPNFADKGIQQSHTTSIQLITFFFVYSNGTNAERKENETGNSQNQKMKMGFRPNAQTKIYIWKTVLPIVIF